MPKRPDEVLVSQSIYVVAHALNGLIDRVVGLLRPRDRHRADARALGDILQKERHYLP